MTQRTPKHGDERINRRTFMKAGAATALTAASWARVSGANDRIGIGMIGMSAVAAVGRNPGASNKIMVLGILMAALAEAIFFVALLLGKTFGG